MPSVRGRASRDTAGRPHRRRRRRRTSDVRNPGPCYERLVDLPELAAGAQVVVTEGLSRFSRSEDPEVVQMETGADAVLLDVPVTDMRAAWSWFRDRRGETGLWPIAVGSSHDLDGDDNGDQRFEGHDVETVLLNRTTLFEPEARSWWLPHTEADEPFEPTDDRFWIDVRPDDRFHYEGSTPQFTEGSGRLALLPVNAGWRPSKPSVGRTATPCHGGSTQACCDAGNSVGVRSSRASTSPHWTSSFRNRQASAR